MDIVVHAAIYPIYFEINLRVGVHSDEAWTCPGLDAVLRLWWFTSHNFGILKKHSLVKIL